MTRPRTLGTLLRHLVEILDADVEAAYRDAGLNYRPRYTPVVRALELHGQLSIRGISLEAGLTHSAASQTVSQMLKHGLVKSAPGADGRERIVTLSDSARAMLPALHRQWDATAEAADDLMEEIGVRLDDRAEAAIEALGKRPFLDRINAARGK